MNLKIATEAYVIKLLREEYDKRLHEALREADVFDDAGNIVIGKDLKVRHKKTQYEYTVDDVYEDPQNGNVMISLRLPNEPRFASPPAGDEIISDQRAVGILDEEELVITDMLTTPDDKEVELLVIDQKEFEREYEVK